MRTMTRDEVDEINADIDKAMRVAAKAHPLELAGQADMPHLRQWRDIAIARVQGDPDLRPRYNHFIRPLNPQKPWERWEIYQSIALCHTAYLLHDATGVWPWAEAVPE